MMRRVRVRDKVQVLAFEGNRITFYCKQAALYRPLCRELNSQTDNDGPVHAVGHVVHCFQVDANYFARKNLA